MSLMELQHPNHNVQTYKFKRSGIDDQQFHFQLEVACDDNESAEFRKSQDGNGTPVLDKEGIEFNDEGEGDFEDGQGGQEGGSSFPSAGLLFADMIQNLQKDKKEKDFLIP